MFKFRVTIIAALLAVFGGGCDFTGDVNVDDINICVKGNCPPGSDGVANAGTAGISSNGGSSAVAGGVSASAGAGQGGTANTGVAGCCAGTSNAGSPSTGGSAVAAGATSTGGTTAASGATSNAGSPSTGGASTVAGSPSTGGTVSAGGVAATGGTVSPGGTTAATCLSLVGTSCPIPGSFLQCNVTVAGVATQCTMSCLTTLRYSECLIGMPGTGGAPGVGGAAATGGASAATGGTLAAGGTNSAAGASGVGGTSSTSCPSGTRYVCTCTTGATSYTSFGYCNNLNLRDGCICPNGGSEAGVGGASGTGGAASVGGAAALGGATGTGGTTAVIPVVDRCLTEDPTLSECFAPVNAVTYMSCLDTKGRLFLRTNAFRERNGGPVIANTDLAAGIWHIYAWLDAQPMGSTGPFNIEMDMHALLGVSNVSCSQVPQNILPGLCPQTDGLLKHHPYRVSSPYKGVFSSDAGPFAEASGLLALCGNSQPNLTANSFGDYYNGCSIVVQRDVNGVFTPAATAAANSFAVKDGVCVN